MKFYEIDDLKFREALYRKVTKDTSRMFEIHFTDLIYCLRSALVSKLIVFEFNDDGESIKTILRWARGKSLHGILSYGIGPSDVAVNIGDAMGSIDLEFDNMPYELKTTAAWKIEYLQPKEYEIMQLSFYMAAKDSLYGRLKKMNVINNMIKTFHFIMSEEELKQARIVIKARTNALLAVLKGRCHWSSLPEAYFPWKCKKCISCEVLEEIEKTGQLTEVLEWWNENAGPKGNII